MPIKQSAKKELRKTVKRTAGNVKRKKIIKDTIKKIRKAVTAGNSEEAKKLMPQASKLLDKAAKGRIIHPNKASRLKSRLQKLVNK